MSLPMTASASSGVINANIRQSLASPYSPPSYLKLGLLYLVSQFLAFNHIHLCNPQLNQNFAYFLSIFINSIPFCYLFHIQLASSCAQLLGTEASWPSQASSKLPILNTTALHSTVDYVLPFFLLASVLKIQETLRSLTQNVISFSKPQISMYLLPFLSFFYRLQLAPSKFKKFSTMLVALILVQDVSIADILHIGIL